MFERNKVDNSQHQAGLPVEVVHADGRVDKGKLLVPVSGRLIDVMNGPQQFLEFESYEGQRRLIAKSTLASVQVVTVPGVSSLSARLKDGEFDPYRILGLEPGASWEEVRDAFHASAKIYHPDRYANAELPAEVSDYLAAMVRRINAAYKALEPKQQTQRQLAKHRSDPIYSNRPLR